MTTRVQGYTFNTHGEFGAVTSTIGDGQSRQFSLSPDGSIQMSVKDDPKGPSARIEIMQSVGWAKEFIVHRCQPHVPTRPHEVTCKTAGITSVFEKDTMLVINPLVKEGNSPVLEISYKPSSVTDRERR